MPKRQHLLLPVLTLLGLFTCILIQYWGYGYPKLGIDDANIYFVYMRNFANGHGFVWTPGGERVEGFTSVLWTLIGGFTYFLSSHYFTLLLICILFLLTYLTILNTLQFVRRVNGNNGPLTSSDVLLLCFFLLPLGFVDWNVLSLMETGLWTFLFTHAILEIGAYIQDWKPLNKLKLSLLLAAMVCTRPESIVFNLLLLACVFFFTFKKENLSRAWSSIGLPLAIHFISLGALVLWRLSYFGYPLPNTFYAKVSSSIANNILSSGKYLLVYFYNYPLHVFLVIVLLFFTTAILTRIRVKGFSQTTPDEKLHLFLLAMFAAGLVLPILTGGDHFKYNRFYQPLLPVLLIASANYHCWKRYLGLQVTGARIPRTALLTGLVCMLFFCARYTMVDLVAARKGAVYYPVFQEFVVADQGRQAAEKMNETFESSGRYPSVGSLAAGGFAFVYKGQTIDLMGLNNVAMAHAQSVKIGYRNHASFDKNVFYEQMPDMMGTFYGAEAVGDTTHFVLPENTPDFRTNSTNVIYTGFKKIYDDARFINTYQPALLQNREKDFFIFDYFSKKYLATLDTTKFFVRPLQRDQRFTDPSAAR